MSYEAEKRVIGCLLMNQDCIDNVYTLLQPEMFELEILGAAYKEFQRGFDRGKTVNYPTLLSSLKGLFGEEYVIGELKECLASTTTTAELCANAEVVYTEYIAKKADEILNKTQFQPNIIDRQLAETASALEALIRNDKSTSMTLSEISETFEAGYFVDKPDNKIRLGFEKIDELVGGLEGGDIIVIGARPAVGKSAFVTQVALNLARQGKRVGFYNLEMKEKQMFERFVVSTSGIGLTRLKKATRFLGDEETKYRRAIEELKGMSNLVISTGSKTVSQIKVESAHMDYDILIIDYLQLLIADKSYKGNRYAEVGAISKAIKAMAMEMNIPIIALTQLNRVSAGTESKEPTMSEIRESGDIEQDASIICLMWNADNYDRTWKGFKVDKNRQGETGTQVMKFDGDTMTFIETDVALSELKEKQGKLIEKKEEIPDFM